MKNIWKEIKYNYLYSNDKNYLYQIDYYLKMNGGNFKYHLFLNNFYH